MRALSKERLSKMHAMLDKELQNEQETLSNHSSLSQTRKERGNFSHLRYTSNLNLDNEFEQSCKPEVKERQREVSSEKQSLFKKSLEKNEKARLEFNKQSRKQYGASLSSSSSSEKQSKSNSMRGSRKNQINELEKKLLDLEKKMENINLSSSSDDDEELPVKSQEKSQPKTLTNTLNKNNSKKAFNVLNLQQNHIENIAPEQIPESNNPNEGTARFNGNKNDEANKKDKIDFKSNLPLSHRKNTLSDEESSNSDDDHYEVKYNKFVKVTRQTRNPSKAKQAKKSESSQEEDSSDEKHPSSALNKSISEQIERLSIMNKQSKVVPNLKPNLSKNKLTQNHSHKNISKGPHAKINSIPVQPERKLTVEHEILAPKYQLQMNQNKSKSRSKKSIKLPKNSLSKDKALSVKNSNRSVKENSTQKKKIQRNHTNLDNSFRSDNSVKSKKSVNSLRSVGSNKSLGLRQCTGTGKIQNLEEKKQLKRIQNLEKELGHFKRLTKRYETEISDYKLMEIQFKKMESQFRKSEQIRIEQKKIIESLKNKAAHNG